MATTKGPPANPNFMDDDIPGIANGILPKIIPKNIPTKRVIIFGSLRRFIEFPSLSARRFISSSFPTTVRRSPICKVRFGLASRSTPARLTRVAFNRYPIGSRRDPIVLPLNSDFVTRMRRDTTGAWMASQSISTVLPIKAFNASSS